MSPTESWVMGCNALHKLFHSLDEHRDRDSVMMFAPHGVWVRQGVALSGREQIAGALAQRPKTTRFQHVISNQVLESDDGNGFVLSFYLTLYKHDGGEDLGGPSPLSGPVLVGFGKAGFVEDSGSCLLAHLSVGEPRFLAA